MTVRRSFTRRRKLARYMSAPGNEFRRRTSIVLDGAHPAPGATIWLSKTVGGPRDRRMEEDDDEMLAASTRDPDRCWLQQ